MNASIREQVVKLATEPNLRFPGNHSYQPVREDQFGSYSIWTVEFVGEDSERYTNFVVSKGAAALKAFYFLSDVVPYLDRRTGFRSLITEQYGLVVGSVVSLLLLAGVLTALAVGREIPRELWLTLSAALGYLFGSKKTATPAEKSS